MPFFLIVIVLLFIAGAASGKKAGGKPPEAAAVRPASPERTAPMPRGGSLSPAASDVFPAAYPLPQPPVPHEGEGVAVPVIIPVPVEPPKIDLRSAVVMAEILGPPRARKPAGRR